MYININAQVTPFCLIIIEVLTYSLPIKPSRCEEWVREAQTLADVLGDWGRGSGCQGHQWNLIQGHKNQTRQCFLKKERNRQKRRET